MTKPGKTAGIVRLDEKLGIAAAKNLAEELRQYRHSPVTIDASNVGHVGANCLQVLLSAARTWRQDSNAFVMINQSQSFREGLEGMGISEQEFLNSGDEV